MSHSLDQYYGETAAMAPASARSAFIKRTYLHVAGAMAAFVGLEAFLIGSGMAEQIIKDIFLASNFAWLGLMVVFIGGRRGLEQAAQGCTQRWVVGPHRAAVGGAEFLRCRRGCLRQPRRRIRNPRRTQCRIRSPRRTRRPGSGNVIWPA